MDTISFDEAFTWLNRFDGSNLSAGNQHLVTLLSGSIRNGSNTESWHIISRLRSSSEHANESLEAAEIFVECGRAAYKLEDFVKAAKFLEDAVQHYGWKRHHNAVASWMLGYAYWEISDQREDTFPVWEKSIDIFEELAGPHNTSRDRSAWYRDQLELLKSTLLCYQQDDSASAASRPGGSSPGSRSQSKSQVGKYTAGPPTTPAVLRLFPIKSFLAMGRNFPEDLDPYAIGHVDINQIDIAGDSYKFLSLRDVNVIDIGEGNFQIWRVSGSSMNRLDINDGDYVLVLKVEDSDDKDILAFWRVEKGDKYLSLLRLNKGVDPFMMEPESYDAHYQPFPVTETELSDNTHGVVLAILKRV